MALQKEKIQDHRISGTPEIGRRDSTPLAALVLVRLRAAGSCRCTRLSTGVPGQVAQPSPHEIRKLQLTAYKTVRVDQ